MTTFQAFAQSKLRAALFAGAALALLAPAAHAAVVIVMPASPITIPNNIDGLYVNVVTGLTASTGATPGWDFNIYNNTAGLTFFVRSGDVSNAYLGSPVSLLSVGSVVGPASVPFSTGIGSQVAGTNFQGASASSYFGFRFTNESTGAVNYGWAQLSTGATVGFPAALIRYGYENTGLAITISAVPEPGTYALMALGLAVVGGIAAKRRKAA